MKSKATINPLKQLAGQTAVYGVSSILGRLINYVLVPIHTYNLVTADYGEVSNMYAFAAIMLVFMTYGLETAFFRFFNTSNKNPLVFSTAFISILFSTVLIAALVILNHTFFAFWLNVPRNPQFVVWFAIIVGMDAIVAIPYAHLRATNRAKKFAVIKLINIGLNVSLNLFFIFLVPWLSKYGPTPVQKFVGMFYHGEILIAYIFIANIIASFIQLLIFVPGIIRKHLKFDYALWKKMMVYALPLLLLGLAGTINQTIDRLLLTWLLPSDIAMGQVGIYTACFKIPIIMYFFLQAFRYAAEPFFFANASIEEARKIFPSVMNAFAILSGMIFLGTMLFLDDVFLFFVDEPYRVGRVIVPVIMFAFIFQGIGFILSMWYKLTNKTGYGAWMALAGTVVIFVVNIFGIPKIGYMASAFAFMLSGLVIVVLSWFLGKRHFPVPYQIGKLFLYLLIPIGVWWLADWITIENTLIRLAFRSFLVILVVSFYFRAEGWNIRKLLNK